MAALLALCGAACWGVGDFFGGLASKRMAVLAVAVVSQSIGLAALLVWIAIDRPPFPGVEELLPAAGAGVAVLFGLAAFYRGLAIGAMGVVAPISATAPMVPLVVDAAHGTTPAATQWLGVALVLLGIAVVSREPSSQQTRFATGAGLALVAAVGFGIFFVGIDAGADQGGAWAVVAARLSAVTLGAAIALATSKSLHPPRNLLPLLAACGLIDTFANVLVATAMDHGAAGTVAVLSALYPLVTIVLARVVLGEQLSVTKRIGGGVALAGAAFVAAG